MTIPHTPKHLFLTAALLFCTLPAAAQNIYKCTQGGQLAYTDHPCPGNSGQLIHKADDAEVIDQFLRLGQNDRAQQYAQARHLDALYKERLVAYQRAQQEKADRQLREEMAARDRAEVAQQQSLAEAAARHERLLEENDALREQNDDYRDQLAQPAYDNAPAYWNGAPSYGYDGYRDHGRHHGRGDHNHYDPQHPRPQPSQPVFHPCTQLAGGRVNC